MARSGAGVTARVANWAARLMLLLPRFAWIGPPPCARTTGRTSRLLAQEMLSFTSGRMGVGGCTVKEGGCPVTPASSRFRDSIASRYSQAARSLAITVGFCGLMFALAKVVSWLPLPQPVRERLVAAILFPLRVVTWVITRVIDMIATEGRPEPASHYLGPSAVNALLVLSVVLLGMAVFALSMGTFSLLRRRKRRDWGA